MLTAKSHSHSRKFRLYCAWALGVGVMLAVPLRFVFAVDFIGYETLSAFAANIIYFFFVYVMGALATMAAKLVVWAANLTGFTTLDVVKESWTVVRDLSNMFFIVILLVVAFGTIFRIEAYSWKKLLPKMILAAILVNYSRAICGLLVDAAQVVTLTFANAISDAAQVGFVEAFKLNEVLDYENVRAAKDTFGSQVDIVNDVNSQTLLATVGAGILLTVLVFVLFVYVAVLVARLAFVWFLTILSPLAFTLMVLPATEKYYKQWWDMFTRYVTVGPMILFFLWLSLFVAAKTENIQTAVLSGEYRTQAETGDALSTTKSGGSMKPSLVAGFVISTMMLFAGLKIAQDSSSEIGQATGKALNMGKWLALGLIAGSVWKATKGAGKGAKAVGGFGVGGGVDLLQRKTGVDFNFRRQWEQLKKDRKERKDAEYAQGYMKASQSTKEGKFRGLFGASGYFWDQYMPFTGRRQGGRSQAAKTYKEYEHLTHAVKADAEKLKFDENNTKMLQANPGDSGYVTDMEKEAAIANAEIAKNKAEALTKSDAWLNGEGWDLTDPGQARNLGEIKNNKQKQLDELLKPRDKTLPPETLAEKTDRATKAGQLMSDIENIDKALVVGGEGGPDAQNVNLQGKFNLHLTREETEGAAKEHLRKMEAELKKANSLNSDGKGGYHAIGNKDQLAAIINDKVAERTMANRELKDRIGQMTQRMTEIMPAIDDESLRQEHHIISEKNKAVEGNDNEDYLVNVGQARLKGGDYMGVLAMFDHLAKVGHDNEIYRIFEQFKHKDGTAISGDVEGFKCMAEIMKDELHLDNDLIMSVMKNVSIAAKRNNHWGYAEMIGSVGGELVWRGDQERQERVYGESSKVGANQIAQKSNRLGYGTYENGKFKLDAGIATLIAQNMHKFRDIIEIKNLFNSNAAEFLAQPEIAEQFKKLIVALQSDEKVHQGKDGKKYSDQDEALRLFNLLTASTLSKKSGGEFDPGFAVVRGAHAAGIDYSSGNGHGDDHGTPVHH